MPLGGVIRRFTDPGNGERLAAITYVGPKRGRRFHHFNLKRPLALASTRVTLEPNSGVSTVFEMKLTQRLVEP